MNPTIIYEDNDILVLNKPSGMTVNNADTTRGEQTVQDWVEKYLGLAISHFAEASRDKQDSRFKKSFVIANEVKQSSQAQIAASVRSVDMNVPPRNDMYDPVQEFYSRGGIVHRLDKETSGILLVAKNPESFSKLKQQFMERTVKKTYLALAHGKVQPEEGEIAVPVGRLEFNRKRFGVVAGGREAVTRYLVIQNYELRIKNYAEKLSLVELHPQTGRTHQIRVHLKHINHPIFADELYAGRKTARDDRKILPRLFLHASKITFTHPTTNQQVELESPLPEELQGLLGKLVKIDD